jgi:hypothetical protein
MNLIAFGLARNGYEVLGILKHIQDPTSYSKHTIKNESFKLNMTHGVSGADYEFEFKNKKITGDGTFIKYTYFRGLEELTTSLEDLFGLYVDISKLLIKSAEAAKEDSYFKNNLSKKVSF